MTLRFAFAILALAIGSATGASASSIVLQSHKAVYELSLISAKSGSGVGDYAGRFAIEWTDACEGYITSQRIVSRLTNTEGGETGSDIQVASWESTDGKVFRFTSRTRTDGELTEDYEGRAETGGGAPPAVIYQKPENVTVDLPPGTVFPTEHSVVMIRAALAGEKVVQANVFDGSGPDKIFRVAAFVSGEKGPFDAERPELVGQRSWRFRIAYFPIAAPDATPDYEIGYRMYANGITTDLVLDYGDFVVQGKLTQLQILPKRC